MSRGIKGLCICGILLIVLIITVAPLLPGQGLPSGILLGRVMYEDSSPAINAVVVAENSRTQSTVSATTNQTGWYLIDDLDSIIGDSIKLTASLGDHEGSAEVVIQSGHAPIYERNITITEVSQNILTWVGIIAVVVLIVVISIYFLGGRKKGQEQSNKEPRSRRRK